MDAISGHDPQQETKKKAKSFLTRIAVMVTAMTIRSRPRGLDRHQLSINAPLAALFKGEPPWVRKLRFCSALERETPWESSIDDPINPRSKEEVQVRRRSLIPSFPSSSLYFLLLSNDLNL
ncbi:unnamed protein product [Linum trigynum]|uniref:Uncharacterized protein n=1 Tax=Linum trigynum TaxID=586398 RepID=A0AAV2FBX0_9ROSI